MDSDEFNNRYFRNPVLLENGAIYIGEWYYICVNKKGLLIKNTEKVSKSGKMGLFMKGSGKTIKLMLKADLLEYGDVNTRSKLEIIKGKTFAMVKPDAYNNIGKIVDAIEKSYFNITNLKITKFTI